MRVAEKETDRAAYVHVYVEGNIGPVSEFGEYVDPRDKAICCYVPLEEDQAIRIRGKFSGTTLAIACDTFVDGVCRKATSFAAKTVHFQKNKKLDTTSFLYKTEGGTLDAKVLVAPLKHLKVSQGDEVETIGTLELRLYITRQLGVTHKVADLKTYYANNNEPGKGTESAAIYSQIAQYYQMIFEKDTIALDAQKASREQRKMDSVRPDTEPWAIFRFHYRSLDAINAHDLPMTFNYTEKREYEPHTLVLHPVPPLIADVKPHKDNGDTLTRASSLSPSEVPPTPTKSPRKGSKVQKPPKSNRESSSKPRSKTKSTAGAEPVSTPDPVIGRDIENAATQDEVDSVISADTAEDDKDASHHTSGTPKKKGTKPGSGQIVEKSDHTPGLTQTIDNDTIVVAMPTAKKNVPTKPVTAKRKSLSDPIKSEDANAKDTAAQEVVKPAVQPNTTSTKRSAIKSTLNTADTSTTQTPTLIPTIPTKRPAPSNTGTPIELKRAKSRPTQLQLHQPETSSTPPDAESPKPLSMERQVAEQRKKLDMIRRRRTEMTEKQSKVDKQMEPYKQRMAEELDRLNAAMMEEEMACKEEQKHLTASVELLRGFRRADSGD